MFKTKIHAGPMATCRVCTPEQKPKRRKDAKPKFEAIVGQDVVSALKRQLNEEVGDDELNQLQQFALLQKCGAVAVRAERKLTRPAWVEENVWKTRINQWSEITRGVATVYQQKRPYQQKQRPQGTVRQATRPLHQWNPRPT